MAASSAVTWAFLPLAVVYAISAVCGQDILARTPVGVVRGIQSTSQSGRQFYSFRGIPYAKPPVGKLRFAPPSPVSQWTEVLNATVDAPSCIQKNYLLPGAPILGQEDCLYLNVYTPQLPKEVSASNNSLGSRQEWKNVGRLSTNPSLPVMVYIYGGGWFSGSASTMFLGPEYIMNSPDVILVSFNYRLGALGFLSTGDAWATGNWAMKDQVEALKWVRDNIAYFGGNPARVTIFGQSAGAASVHYHMLSPLSRGLFHASITQSGTAFSPWAWPQSDPSAIARRQGELVGCLDMDSARLIECLRGVPAGNITDSIDGFKFWSVDPLTVFTPVIESGCKGNPPCPFKPDDPFLTAHPYVLVAQGQFNPRLPWMVGVVPQEGILRAVPILTTPSLLEDLNERLDTIGPRLFELDKSASGPEADAGDLWKAVSNAYFTTTPGGAASIGAETAEGFIDAYTDRGFLHATHKAVKMHTGYSHYPVYLYEFTYRGLMSYTSLFANTSTNYGVSHCDDLLYLFRTPVIFPEFPPGSQEMRIVNLMVAMWTNFAKFGNPTPEKSLKVIWDPVRPGCHNHLSIGAELEMKEQLHEDRIEFWDSLPLLENRIANLWNTMIVQIQTWMNYLVRPFGSDCDKYYLVNGVL